MSNVVGVGAGYLPPAPGTGFTFVDVDKIYSFSYERRSASYTISSATFSGGDFYRSVASCFVPRMRMEVETLLMRMRNRPVFAIAIDRYDNQYYLYDAILRWGGSTGDTGPAKNGYNITFNAVCDYLYPGMSGSGDIPTAPAPPGGGGGGEEVCCVSIYPTNIAYTPADTGNALNLSQMVTTIDGSVYFIDYTGRSVLLSRPSHTYYKIDVPDGYTLPYVTIPVGYPLPDPGDYPDPTYDTQMEISRRMLTKQGPRWLSYLHPEGYYIDFSTRRAYFESELANSRCEFYFFDKILPIAL
ncbi:MAG TPA: hypothetical protein VFG10_18980 [Saprospiraceae bacterium]|nr:hypothetical protein [Saprospiraceae bacterium]